MTKQALVGMSGGVDSSVAAYLVREAGYEVTGATMRLFDNETIGITDKTCCSLSSIEDACAVANKLGISYVVYDMRPDFRREVIDRFVSAYEHGATPNPCVACNKYLKFDRLYELSASDLLEGNEESTLSIATGHYAVIEKSPSGRFMLRKGADPGKDQSYFLYDLTQEQLSRTLFPLGNMTKQEVREIAGSLDLVTAKKRESQDICFVPGGDYAAFICGYTGHDYPPGDFVSTDGTVMGRHKGIINYTIGQRKGLGLALKKPAYVLELDTDRNRVILGDNEELFTRELTAESFNWVSMAAPSGDVRASARIRYRHHEAPATVIPISEDSVRIIFDEPQRAITRGQSVVVYDGEYVLGGGIIR
ncbi:MAG: tRNA 2-thiouridine(34) synthase MnmA [Mogibacterium sp.]|nr:tRNA 2-thiouridine(34) synthase MnmA [Mogibacterium sp.]MBR2539434.1 tRNA 2-thiouridine(34) synthase MnmA [Mogibacterium sp.]